VKPTGPVLVDFFGWGGRNWGIKDSQAKKKIGRGKLSVSTSQRKYGSQVSLWGKNS
jgi:hypothetical protein